MSFSTRHIPSGAAWIGGLGLLPFLFGAALAVVPPVAAPVDPLTLFMGYSAVILSFLGGVRWGVAIANGRRHDTGLLIWSVLPALLAWPALLMPAAWGLLLLAGSHLLFGLLDSIGAGLPGAPSWYSRLRVQLTAIALLCHLPWAYRLWF